MMQRLTIERSTLVIVFVLLFALATRIPTDTDTWWHIRSGEYTLTQGMIYGDPFSFTRAGETWINHSWGSQIILYLVWQVGGNFGLAVFTAGLATAGMAFVYACCAGNAYLRAFAVVLGAATAAVFWSARPQMLSFLLSAVILYLLHRHKRDRVDWLYAVVPVMWLWGNLHAGFSIGFILLGGSLAGEVFGNLFNRGGKDVVPWAGVRKLALVTAVSVPVMLLNPYGLNMLLVPFNTVSIGALQNFIQEWNSPNFHGRETWAFIGLLLLTFGAVGAGGKRLGWTDFLLFSGTTFMALLAGRNVALFAIVATPILTYHADAALAARGWVLRPLQRVPPRMARLNLALIVLITLGSALKVFTVLDAPTVRDAQAMFLPLDAADYVRQARPPGPLFNSYNWGGYLMFALPDYPVFVDGRTDLYGDDFLMRWLRAWTAGDDWQQTFSDYGIRLVIVEKSGDLARVLRGDPAWTLAHQDDLAAVFTRSAP